MRKWSFLLITLLVVSLSAFAPVSWAQDTVAEVDVVEDLVFPRLIEYNENLPAHYGTLKLEDFLVMLAEQDVTIVDVREVSEVEEFGIIEGAINIPLRTLGENLALLPDQNATIVVVCKGGFRATIGMTALHVLGYENAQVLVGGFDAWLGEELPVVEAPAEVMAGFAPETIDPLLVSYVSNYLTNLPQGWGSVRPVDLFEQMIDTPPDYLYDVRSDAEWADPGYIEGAQHLWIDEFVMNRDLWPADPQADIVVYCASGYRGNVASVMLGLMGYENVRNLSGGVTGWIAADLPLETA